MRAATEEARWMWVPTDHNIADLGTRANAKPEDLEEGSIYQRGPAWLSEPERLWPIRTDFRGAVPDEEFKKMKLTLAFNSTPGGKPWFDIARFSSLNKAKNVMYRILKFVDCMMVSKKKRDHNQQETLMQEARLRVAAHAVIISHCQEIDRSPEDLRKLKNLG
ncbi:MAG: hypothetical protein GY696_05130, partial [Gammaproteobacteria bacterium]|nr:hypothetical protein [Gammaproteobacteria bacterium]